MKGKNSSQESLRQDTRKEIKNLGEMRDKIERLEKCGIPRQRKDFEELRDGISDLLDDLLVEDRISMQTSHMIRIKLQRIDAQFDEMEKELSERAGEDNSFDRDKETQDSKLHVVQLMLSQIFPHLKKAI